MASGVTVDDAVTSEYENLKIRKKHKYLMLGLSEDKTKISILKKGEKGETWANFRDQLQTCLNESQCRYCVYDYEYKNKDGTAKSKPILISWTPENASVKEKMVYASSKSALRKCLSSGFALDKECHDMDDINEDDFDSELAKK